MSCLKKWLTILILSPGGLTFSISMSCLVLVGWLLAVPFVWSRRAFASCLLPPLIVNLCLLTVVSQSPSKCTKIQLPLDQFFTLAKSSMKDYFKSTIFTGTTPNWINKNMAKVSRRKSSLDKSEMCPFMSIVAWKIDLLSQKTVDGPIISWIHQLREK